MRLKANALITIYLLLILIIFSSHNLLFASSINIALDAVATANEEYSTNNLASKAIDGIDSTNWSASGFGTVSNPDWLIIDLNNIYSIDKIVLKSGDSPTWSSSYYINYNLYYSTDNVNWVFMVSGSLIDDPTEYFDEVFPDRKSVV